MQHFLESVNECRGVFFLGNEIQKDCSDFLVVNSSNRDMEVGSEDAARVDAEYAFKRRIFIDPEGVNVFECIESFSGDDTPVGNREFELSRIAGDEEVTNDAEEDEGNRHHEAIGEDRIGDDEREENSR